MIRRLAAICFLVLAMGACAPGDDNDIDAGIVDLDIVVEGDGVTVLDTRDIFFLVPPEIPDVPID